MLHGGVINEIQIVCGQVSVTAIDEFLNELIDKGYTDVIWVYLDNDIAV